MNNDNQEEPITLPALISLPVHRADYCDQKTTDLVMDYLWKEEGEYVANMAAVERYSYPWCRDDEFRKWTYHIEYALREKEIDGFNEKGNDLAIMSILFELSRRLRKVQGLKEIPVFGNALGPSPKGPLPPVMNVEVSCFDELNSKRRMTQEMSDRVCGIAYERDPGLMFRVSEEQRHHMLTYKTNGDLERLIEGIKKKEQVEDIESFSRELENRLKVMCNIPPYEEIVKILE